MHPRTPFPHHPLYDETDDEELMLACASSGCSSCLYYFDVDDGARAFRRARTARPVRLQLHRRSPLRR